MAGRLRDKVAVVTGAGEALGREVARLLAREGAAVVVNHRRPDSAGGGGAEGPAEAVVGEIRAGGGRAVATEDDVCSWTGAERIIGMAIAEFGRIDILVNNAGVLRDGMMLDLSEGDWDAVIGVHLTGTFNCTRHACVHMRQQRGGRIISISSTAGLYGSVGQANYAAATDGIVGLTRVVAREMGKYGVTVNAVAPSAGVHVTDPAQGRAGAASATGEVMPPEPELTSQSEAVASLVVFLATDGAANINGQTFAITGGVVAHVNDPAPVRTIQKMGRWTAAEIASVFPLTLGRELV